MINLYFVDYYNELNNNGLNTYTAQLTKKIFETRTIKTTIVWINSTKYKTLTKDNLEHSFHLHIPQKNKSLKNHACTNVELANILIDDIGGKKEVLIHLNWINHCSAAWHIKQRVNCKIILTKHCIPWKDLVINNYKVFYKINSAFINKHKIAFTTPQLQQELINYEQIDHIITVTDCAKKNLELLFNVEPSKITVINNGLELKLIDNKKVSIRELRKKYGFSEKEKIILFASTLREAKGVMDLVSIFEKFLNDENVNKDVRLVIAGAGNTNDLLKRVKKYWAKITITGNLDKDTLYDFYRLANLGIVPSYAEQCSYTAIEMMYFGLPIIVSDVDGLSEIVPDDCGLKMKIDFEKEHGASVNSSDLFKMLTLLLNDKSYAKILARNAKKHSIEKFNSQLMFEKTMSVYQKIIKAQKKAQIASPVLPSIDMPLVTILLVYLNATEYFDQTINSILEQSYNNFELLIIDNSDKEDIMQLVACYEDKRIRLTKNKTIKSIASCLNKGLKLAKGEYIVHVDENDLMKKDRLISQIVFLETNQEYAVIGSFYNVIDPHGMTIKRVEMDLENEELRLAMLFSNPFKHSTMAIRSSVAKQLDYNLKWKYCEDCEWLFRLPSKLKIKNLPIPLNNSRPYLTNLSHQDLKIKKQNTINLLSRELDKLNILHSTDELILHAAIFFGYGSDYFNTIDKQRRLNNWLDKVFSADQVKKDYSQYKLKKFKKNILSNYCWLN